MSAPREELAAANERLTAAINDLRLLVWDDGRERMLTDYVVVFAEQGFDEDGDPVTVTGQLYPDGYLAGYRALGLLAMAQHHVAHGTTEPA